MDGITLQSFETKLPIISDQIIFEVQIKIFELSFKLDKKILSKQKIVSSK